MASRVNQFARSTKNLAVTMLSVQREMKKSLASVVVICIIMNQKGQYQSGVAKRHRLFP